MGKNTTEYKGPFIAFDTETHLIRPGVLAPPIVCLTYRRDEEEPGICTPTEGGIDKVLDEILSGDKVSIGHNVAYDFAVVAEKYPQLLPRIVDLYEDEKVFDTKIFDHMAHIGKGWSKKRPDGTFPKYSLEALVSRYLDEKVEGKHGEDVWRLRYHELDGVPLAQWPKAALDYAKLDADYTYRVAEVFIPHAPNYGTYALQVKAAFALHLMSVWGLRTDNERVALLKADLEAKNDEYMELLREAGVARANGSKNITAVKELVRKAYEAQGRRAPKTKPTKKNPQGSIKTDRETLMNSGSEFLEEYAEGGKTAKLLNTFIPVLERGTKYSINPRYNVLVDSGRTSANDPNIQQLPRKGGVRECFIPREGRVYVGADYHVAELCSLSQVNIKLHGWSKMADAINAGRDPHLQTTASVLGMTYEDVLEGYEAEDPRIVEGRQTSKIVNFGLPGGLSVNGLIKYAKGFGVDLSYTEAGRLREIWLHTYPEMNLYFEWISVQTAFGATFTSVHPVTGYVRGGLGYTDGANHMFQHLTATGAKQALWEVAYESYTDPGSDLYGCRAPIFVHDEIITEAPRLEVAHEAAERLATVMEEAMAVYLPDVKCKADPFVAYRWYKGAKGVRDANGRLVPWEPSAKAA